MSATTRISGAKHEDQAQRPSFRWMHDDRRYNRQTTCILRCRGCQSYVKRQPGRFGYLHIRKAVSGSIPAFRTPSVRTRGISRTIILVTFRHHPRRISPTFSTRRETAFDRSTIGFGPQRPKGTSRVGVED